MKCAPTTRAVMFYWVGGAFIVAAVVGAAEGAASGTRQDVAVSTGLIAAASLLVAAGWGLLASTSSGSGRMRDTHP